jgi:hypothetical protein
VYSLGYPSPHVGVRSLLLVNVHHANVLTLVLVQGRKEEAWKIVARLHNSEEGNNSFAKEEFYQISQQVESDKALHSGESVWDLFRKPSYRKRMICGALTMFASESSAILVIYSMFHRISSQEPYLSKLTPLRL